MAECPQYPVVPQVVPVYQTPPTTPNVSYPLPGQPIFGPVPATHFGYPPVAWPVHHFPQTPPAAAAAYGHPEDEPPQEGAFAGVPLQHVQLPPPPPLPQQHPVPVYFNGEAHQTFQRFLPPRVLMMHHSRNAGSSSKFDTKHEEFRKYLEESGILSTFTNVLAEMYQDPLRPNDPLAFIREQLSCSNPETIELSNLRLWCEQYQIRTERLEKELKHVIERLRNHEPYDTDDSFINESPSVNACKSCVLEVSKQEHVLRKIEDNGNYESFNNNNP